MSVRGSTPVLGHPALRRLARMKLRGLVRRQLRRMKSVSGLLFMGIGLLLMAGWIGSILFTPRLGSTGRWEGPLLRSTVQFGLLFFTVISLASAISVRGVYFPKQEIERLLSIPVTRADLVRYRLQVDMARTLLGALILAIVTNRRMPVPLYGFVGAFLSVLTLTILRQMASLLLADAQGRVGRFLAKHNLAAVRILLAVLAWLAIMFLLFGEGILGEMGGIARGKDAREVAETVLLHPVAQVVLAPFRPWAEMMTAGDAGAFLGWTGACIVLGLLLFELTARVPIDFRELSLQTSEEVARRLRSLRRGGPFTGGKISDAAAGRRVPWIFGRGPFGAVAWIKTASILRKARGTLLISVFVVGLVTVVLSFAIGGEHADEARAAIAGPALIALLGMWYLAGGLRFDFRADLDRMESIKSWPVGPAKLFLATILPETLLIWVVLSVAIVVRALVLDLFHPAIFVPIAALPFLTLAWLSVDNAVFLLAPVRFVPGQEGSLHHTGRALVMLFLRMVLFGVAGSLVGAMVFGTVLLARGALELGPTATAALAGLVGLAMLAAVDAALVYAGGRMLRRFDLARDRA